ncbi:EamA family transporter [Minwuia sp.]|uniref:EamA family transporter n=1 Tax=Minwuia sp. TaxID=2493630 RepID=UPI003A910CA5
MPARDAFLAVLAALIWGATFPFSALALEETPPLFFTFLRFLAAGVFILTVPKPAMPWRHIVTLGVLLGAGQYGLMFFAMSGGFPAGLASLLIHTQAFFTVIMAVVFFRETPGPRHAIAGAVALAGLLLLASAQSETGTAGGLALILFGALCAAGGNMILKSLGGANPLHVAVWMSAAAAVPLLALSLLLETANPVSATLGAMTWKTAVAVLYSALLATVLVYTIWGRLLVQHSAAIVAPFFLLVPVFGISLSWLFLGETLSRLQAVGCLLIFAGLAAVLWPVRTGRA